MRIFTSIFCSVCLFTCAPPPKQSADLLITNAVIWTGNETAGDASSLMVTDGEIVYVGVSTPTNITADKTIDLGGAFLMPGFMDNHTHFFEGGAALSNLDLRTAGSKAEFIARVTKFVETMPEGRWITNGNWDHENWGGELPHKDWIDALTPNNPAHIYRLDGHMVLANSLALAQAGITRDTPNPEGGIIDRDENGEPTGILRDNALNLVLAKIPPPNEAALLDQFLAAQNYALSLGLVKVHAITGYPTEVSMLDQFKLAQDKGIMKIRAFVSLPLDSWKIMADASTQGKGDARLHWGGVKGFMDGSLGSRTAWMHAAYSDEAGNFGLPLNPTDKMQTLMDNATQAGLQISVHGIGDKAIDTIITLMETSSGDALSARRFRLEHFQHPTKEAVARISALGIIASMQPAHATDDGRWASGRLGPERLPTTYAFRDILDNGGVLTFGSDWPVASLNPMDGIYAAVTRNTGNPEHAQGWVPAQKISVEEALTAYTKSNAFAFFEEDVAGTLEVGKRADFIILSADPRTTPPEALRGITTLETWIDGEQVYTAKAQ